MADNLTVVHGDGSVDLFAAVNTGSIFALQPQLFRSKWRRCAVQRFLGR